METYSDDVLIGFSSSDQQVERVRGRNLSISAEVNVMDNHIVKANGRLFPVPAGFSREPGQE